MNDTLRNQIKRVNYNPAVDGGAVGATINLGAALPAGTIVTRIIGVAGTTLVGATGAKMAVYVGSTLGITAHACGGATFVGLDVLNSTPFKISADSEVRVFPRAAVIRTGSYDLIVECIMP